MSEVQISSDSEMDIKYMSACQDKNLSTIWLSLCQNQWKWLCRSYFSPLIICSILSLFLAGSSLFLMMNFKNTILIQRRDIAFVIITMGLVSIGCDIWDEQLMYLPTSHFIDEAATVRCINCTAWKMLLLHMYSKSWLEIHRDFLSL